MRKEKEKKEIPASIYNALLTIEKYCLSHSDCLNCICIARCPIYKELPEYWNIEANYKPTPTEEEPTEEQPTKPAINVYFNIDKINISFPANCCDTRQEE